MRRLVLAALLLSACGAVVLAAQVQPVPSAQPFATDGRTDVGTTDAGSANLLAVATTARP